MTRIIGGLSSLCAPQSRASGALGGPAEIAAQPAENGVVDAALGYDVEIARARQHDDHVVALAPVPHRRPRIARAGISRAHLEMLRIEGIVDRVVHARVGR